MDDQDGENGPDDSGDEGNAIDEVITFPGEWNKCDKDPDADKSDNKCAKDAAWRGPACQFFYENCGNDRNAQDQQKLESIVGQRLIKQGDTENDKVRASPLAHIDGKREKGCKVEQVCQGHRRTSFNLTPIGATLALSARHRYKTSARRAVGRLSSCASLRDQPGGTTPAVTPTASSTSQEAILMPKTVSFGGEAAQLPTIFTLVCLSSRIPACRRKVKGLAVQTASLSINRSTLPVAS